MMHSACWCHTFASSVGEQRFFQILQMNSSFSIHAETDATYFKPPSRSSRYGVFVDLFHGDGWFLKSTRRRFITLSEEERNNRCDQDLPVQSSKSRHYHRWLTEANDGWRISRHRHRQWTFQYLPKPMRQRKLKSSSAYRVDDYLVFSPATQIFSALVAANSH